MLTSSLTFTNLHSRESEKAGNISSYFWTASYKGSMKDNIYERELQTTQLFSISLLKDVVVVGFSYLSIQHVHTEVAESCLKEIVLCAVFQQSAVHCMCSNLETHQHK